MTSIAIGTLLPSTRQQGGGGWPIISALNSVSLGGDSLMGYGNASASGTPGGTSVSHVEWANDKFRQAGGAGFDTIGLWAIPGSTIEHYIANQQASILADPTDGAWLHTGINNFNDGIAGGRTLQQNIDALKGVIDTLRTAKKYVIIDALTPLDQGGISGAIPRWAEIPPFNAAIKAYCDTFPNVIFNDIFSVEVDPSSPVNNPLPNIIRADDGIHKTTYGAQVEGYASFANIAPRLNLTKYKTPGSNVLLPFDSSITGTKTAGSGTITGNVPAGWNVQNISGSAAVAVSSPSAGKLRLSCTNAGAGSATVYLQATNAAALLALGAMGNTLQGGFDFDVISLNKLTRIAGTLRLDGSTGFLWNIMARTTANEPDAVAKFPTTPFSGRRMLKPFTLGASRTQVEFIIAVNIAATDGAAVVDFSLPFLNALS
jgi:hypothetical protein